MMFTHAKKSFVYLTYGSWFLVLLIETTELPRNGKFKNSERKDKTDQPERKMEKIEDIARRARKASLKLAILDTKTKVCNVFFFFFVVFIDLSDIICRTTRCYVYDAF